MIVFQLSVFYVYVIFLVNRYGILPSISESYYRLGKLNWLFIVFAWALAAGTIAQSTPLFFFSGAFMGFVGAASAFKKSMTSTVHYVGASGSIIFAMLGFWFDYGLWWPALFALIGGAVLANLPNRIWWIEIYCFAIYILGIWTK